MAKLIEIAQARPGQTEDEFWEEEKATRGEEIRRPAIYVAIDQNGDPCLSVGAGVSWRDISLILFALQNEFQDQWKGR